MENNTFLGILYKITELSNKIDSMENNLEKLNKDSNKDSILIARFLVRFLGFIVVLIANNTSGTTTALMILGIIYIVDILMDDRWQ